jgi:hypothetical protein
MDKGKEFVEFMDDDIKKLQKHFHALIIERAKTGWDCMEFLESENKNLPVISNNNQKKKEWFPVPGMYGGFSYKLFSKNGKPVLNSSSWSRVVGGSGQRHEITEDGYVLMEEGFV